MSQLTELPELELTGLNLRDYATYVRKTSTGGEQDFRVPLANLMAVTKINVAQNKTQLRNFAPQAANEIAACKGGVFPYDNEGGWYITEESSAADNDGDRIRPNNYEGLVWFKFLI